MYTEYNKLKYTDEMYIIYIIIYGIVHDIFVAVLHTAEGVCFLEGRPLKVAIISAGGIKRQLMITLKVAPPPLTFFPLHDLAAVSEASWLQVTSPAHIHCSCSRGT